MAYGYRPGIQKAAVNSYGNKTGPQTKGSLNSSVGARPFQYALDLGLGIWDNKRYDRFVDEQVDPANAMTQRLLQGSGILDKDSSPIGYSDQYGGSDVAFADQAFSDQDINQQYDSVLGGVQGELSNLPDQIRRQQSGAVGNFNDTASGLNRRFSTGASDINAGYQGSLGTARGLVGQQSQQDRTDINRQYNQERSGQQQNLASQGLLGSTVGASVGGGIERQRRDALQRQSDQRLNQQLGVEESFGGRALEAQTGLLGAESTLGANLAGTSLQGGLNAASLNASTGLGALGQRGQIGQAELDALRAARLNRYNARYGRTQQGIGARGDVLNYGASLNDQRIVIAPTGSR